MRTLRLALLLCIVLIPGFGVALHQADAGYVDPWWLRGLVEAIAVVILVGTFVSTRVAQRAFDILVVYLCGLVGWIGGLAFVNDLQPEITLGFLFTYVAVGVMMGFAYDHVKAYAAVLFTGTLFAFVLTLGLAEAETDRWVFLLCVVASGVTLLLSAYAQVSDRAALAEREATLEEAERLGQLGNWSHDLTTGRRTWSDGMFNLIGIEPHGGEPPALFDYVPPRHRARVAADERKMLDGEASGVDHTYAIVRADGVQREVHSIVRMVRSPEGEAERLIGVVTDVTLQEEHMRGMLDARRAAEQAATLQSSILANMSHEIRTPLTAIIGFAQLLREEIESEYHDLIEPIEHSGERLLETLSALLDLSRTEADAVTLDAREVDLVSMLRTVVAMWERKAAARGLSLRFDAPEAPVIACAAPKELKSALSNIVSNGLKFTDHGSVAIRISKEDGQARIEIADTGKGIDPAFVPLLFQPFWQESFGTRRSHEGTGLGLAVAHRFIEAMGGTLDVESTVGEGTTFTLRLPLAEASADLPPAGTAWISRRPRRAPEDAEPGVSVSASVPGAA